MPSEYAKSLGARLRSIRQQQGLSLQGVEEKSAGRWKAVVVGSYERGDRAVTVSRLAELAEFYRVPVAELLPEGSGVRHEPTNKIVLDLERLYDTSAEDLAYVARYARAIQQQRGDYNGRVLSIRADDLRALAIVYDASPSGLVEGESVTLEPVLHRTIGSGRWIAGQPAVWLGHTRKGPARGPLSRVDLLEHGPRVGDRHASLGELLHQG